MGVKLLLGGRRREALALDQATAEWMYFSNSILFMLNESGVVQGVSSVVEWSLALRRH